MKVVLKLCEKFFKTKRCITADNFFTSIGLCLHLWEQSLEYIGTIRSNKLEIPFSFLKINWDQLVPQYLLLKTRYLLFLMFQRRIKLLFWFLHHVVNHHVANINIETQKPEIIMDYNKYKGIEILINFNFNIFNFNSR